MRTWLVLVAATVAVALGLAYRSCQKGTDVQVGIRIIEGEEARSGEFPWMAAVLRQGDSPCGGTLYNGGWIITAAHCVRDRPARDFSVEIGITTLHTVPAVPVTHVCEHPHSQTGRRPLVYDVAILTLKTPEADDTSSATIGSVVGTPKVTVVGWGDTNPGPPYEPSRTLLKVDVSTVSRETCNAEHREYKGQIVDQHLCYGDAPKDSCHGDSGGPVMLQANKAVVGLISDGGFCGQPKLWSTAIRFDRDDIKKWIDSRATKTPTGPCFERPHQ